MSLVCSFGGVLQKVGHSGIGSIVEFTVKLRSMHRVLLFSDGACSVNPGRGGWACILQWMGQEKELSGGLDDTTNNRMELMGIIKGLEFLGASCEVTITTDSKYVVDGYTKGWVFNWMKKPNFGGKKNPDLWKRLVKACERHKVTFQWVKGHNGHPLNERCDVLAVAQYQPNMVLEVDHRNF